MKIHQAAMEQAQAAFCAATGDPNEPVAVEAAVRAYVMALPQDGVAESRIPEHVAHARQLLDEAGLQNSIMLLAVAEGINVVWRISVELTKASRHRQEVTRLVQWSMLEDRLRPGNPLLGAINQVNTEVKAIMKALGK